MRKINLNKIKLINIIHLVFSIEYLAGKTKSFYEEFEERENEIPGIPQNIEEIKISPMPENISDEPAENFLKATTEYDKAYSFEVPKNSEDKEEKEEIKISKEQKNEMMKFFCILMERMELIQQLDEEKGIKKIKFKSIDEFHETCFKKFRPGKYKNNPEQEKKDLRDFINSIDLHHIIKMIINYNLNFEELNNNIEDEKDNESFENSTEEEKNHMFPEKFKEEHIFT